MCIAVFFIIYTWAAFVIWLRCIDEMKRQLEWEKADIQRRFEEKVYADGAEVIGDPTVTFHNYDITWYGSLLLFVWCWFIWWIYPFTRNLGPFLIL